jgi:zinc transport system substrate-binding protein
MRTPPGTNPHLFELPPKQIQKILQSSLWLRLGEPMEKKFLEIFDSHNPHLRIVDLSEGIAMLELPHAHEEHHCSHCQHDGHDRHFWMSPTLVKQQVTKIAETLADLFPQHAAEYRSNLALGLDQLTKLDEEVRSLLAKGHPEAIVISHPALGYFCRDHGIEQLSIEIEDKEPLPGDLAALVEKIEQKKVSTVFLLPQHNNQGALRVADLLRMNIQSIDPYAIDYPAAVRATAIAIAESTITAGT